ncbi:MAG: DNA-deoxyinosine glycosylase [Pseudomonas sp.]
MTKTILLQGLPAQLDAHCHVLVLGSMPGAQSLAQARYYAHPRNRFWPLMGRLLGFDPALDYPMRIAALNRAGVGLWDVIGQCARSGSLDASIERASIVANPLPALLATLPQLAAVACNGAAAAQAWRGHVAPRLEARHDALPVLTLPSTSPANAAFAPQRLEQAWNVLLRYLPAP